jgi:hypothetical protein
MKERRSVTQGIGLQNPRNEAMNALFKGNHVVVAET